MPCPTINHEIDSRVTPEMKAARIERIKQKVEIDANGCWIYRGSTRPNGYVVIIFRKRPWVGHRLMYALAKGPIPPEMFVCHSCDVRNCINPDHLWLGTNKDNALDASAKGRVHGQRKTHCPKGHPYAGENLLVSHGRRHCKACRMEASRKLAEKRRKWDPNRTRVCSVPDCGRPLVAHQLCSMHYQRRRAECRQEQRL